MPYKVLNQAICLYYYRWSVRAGRQRRSVTSLLVRITMQINTIWALGKLLIEQDDRPS